MICFFKCRIYCLLGLLLCLQLVVRADSYSDVKDPPHRYWERTPADRFTLLKPKLEAGTLFLDGSDELKYLKGMLDALEIPTSSQLLVFSATSLQSGLITKRNPRALYFNEDTYVGYIPGGRLEVISMDPDLGAIFYIFDIPRTGNARPDRSRRCMNCHSGAEMGWVPGLSIKSVMPGPNNGSLDAFRVEQTGHQIPFKERLGGWYVTGAPKMLSHQGNRVGDYANGKIVTTELSFGKQFNLSRYPLPTSDILPHLIFEHQAGFINRVVEATYRARTYQELDKNGLTTEHDAELGRQAELLVRYLLFADEAKLPEGGLAGAADFKKDFLAQRKPSKSGSALRDLDLKSRLFKYRCSYMIYSVPFQGLPDLLKRRVFDRLGTALNLDEPDKAFDYLSREEKVQIRSILRDTLQGLPSSW